MKQRFILFRRSEMYYCEDTTTKKQVRLKTKSKSEALTLVHAKNEAYRQPALNLQRSSFLSEKTYNLLFHREFVWDAYKGQPGEDGNFPCCRLREIAR